MKLKIYFFITAILISSIMYSQNKIDTTKYFLNIDNAILKSKIEYCISEMHEWNAKQHLLDGIVNAFVATDESNNISIKLFRYYPFDTIIKVLPDYYSYAGNQIIFWHTGKSCLSNSEHSEFRQFVIDVYMKTAYKPHKFLSKSTVSQEEEQAVLTRLAEYRKKRESMPKHMTAEQAQQYGIEPITIKFNGQLSLPLYTIQVSGNNIIVIKQIAVN